MLGLYGGNGGEKDTIIMGYIGFRVQDFGGGFRHLPP